MYKLDYLGDTMDANRTFEQTDLTKLVLEALIMHSLEIKKHRTIDFSKFDQLIKKIENENLDVRFVSRDE